MMRAWLTDLRKTALLALIGTILVRAYPAWSAVRALTNMNWRYVPEVGFAILALVVPPIFYLAVFRSDRIPVLVKSLRSLALVAAGVLTVYQVVRTITWAGSLSALIPLISHYGGETEAEKLLGLSQDQAVIRITLATIGMLAGFPPILLLIAMFRQRLEVETEDGNKIDLPHLRNASILMLAPICVGIALLLGYAVNRFASLPEIRRAAEQFGRMPPSARDIIWQTLRSLPAQLCSMVAPYVFLKSLPRVV